MSNLLPNTKEVAPNVYYTTDTVVCFDQECIAFLKERAQQAQQRRARLCAHTSPDATHHSMLIVTRGDGIFPPHRHTKKAETMTVIEGSADALLFDESGTATKTIHMSPPQDGGVFSYYMPADIYHTILPRSDWYVFIETTQGPFEEAGMDTPLWGPNVDDPDECERWRAQCESAVSTLSENES